MTNPFADGDGDGDGDGIFNCARTTGSEPGSAGRQRQATPFALNQASIFCQPSSAASLR